MSSIMNESQPRVLKSEESEAATAKEDRARRPSQSARGAAKKAIEIAQ